MNFSRKNVAESVYPELRTLMGTRVPDLRGLFLRGRGGNSSALGQKQEDAGRNIQGNFTALLQSMLDYMATGAFYIDEIFPPGGSEGRVPNYETPLYALDASRSWGADHTANEFRPINMAVRYLVRALK